MCDLTLWFTAKILTAHFKAYKDQKTPFYHFATRGIGYGQFQHQWSLLREPFLSFPPVDCVSSKTLRCIFALFSKNSSSRFFCCNFFAIYSIKNSRLGFCHQWHDKMEHHNMKKKKISNEKQKNGEWKKSPINKIWKITFKTISSCHVGFFFMPINSKLKFGALW